MFAKLGLWSSWLKPSSLDSSSSMLTVVGIFAFDGFLMLIMDKSESLIA